LDSRHSWTVLKLLGVAGGAGGRLNSDARHEELSMIALEIEAPIVNHRIDVSSDLLPANVAHAKVIVMYEEAAIQDQTAPGDGPLAEFRANPIKVKSFVPLSREDANAR
jgi:hypothetical protein